jgi:acyl carrier protein
MSDTRDVVVGLLAAATGEDAGWAAAITDQTRLEDLRLESIDVASLAGRLAERYGAGVDLNGYLAGLTIDELVALTVGDLVGYVARTAP